MRAIQKYEIKADIWDLECGINDKVLDKLEDQMKTARVDTINYVTAYRSLIFLEEAAESRKIKDLSLKNIQLHPESYNIVKLDYSIVSMILFFICVVVNRQFLDNFSPTKIITSN